MLSEYDFDNLMYKVRFDYRLFPPFAMPNPAKDPDIRLANERIDDFKRDYDFLCRLSEFYFDDLGWKRLPKDVYRLLDDRYYELRKWENRRRVYLRRFWQKHGGVFRWLTLTTA